MRLRHGWQANLYLFFAFTLILLATKSFNICHCSPLGKGFTYDISGDYLVSTFYLLKTVETNDRR